MHFAVQEGIQGVKLEMFRNNFPRLHVQKNSSKKFSIERSSAQVSFLECYHI